MNNDKTNIVILSQPRTGSNNLIYALNAHPDVNIGNELFHPQNGVAFDDGFVIDNNEINDIEDYNLYNMRRHWTSEYSDATFDKVVAHIQDQYTGFKVHLSHLPMQRIRYLLDHHGYYPILLDRRNKFEQALSHFISVNTGYWHMDEKKAREKKDIEPFTVSEKAFINWAKLLHFEFFSAVNLLNNLGIPYLVIAYEELFQPDFDKQVDMITNVWSTVGLPIVDFEANPAVYKKLQNHLVAKRQKMNPTQKKMQLVNNYAELAMAYVGQEDKFKEYQVIFRSNS